MKLHHVIAGILLATSFWAAAGMATPMRVTAVDRELAWRAFLGAGRLRYAYRLALDVVHAEPGNITWMKRLAHVALASGHSDTALAVYLRLTRDGYPGYLDRAIDLASGLGATKQLVILLEIKLRHSPFLQPLWMETLGALRSQNKTNQAVRILQAADRRHPRRFFLWEQVVLYHSLGEPDKELQILQQYRERYGPEPKVMLQIATLRFTRGKILAAYHALFTARSRAQDQDVLYWHTLAALAWLTQDYATAREVSTLLYRHGEANANDLLHLILLVQARHPRTAFRIAAYGWHRYRQASFFLAMLATASSLNNAALRARAFDMLRPADLPRLTSSAFFWTSRAHYLLGRGDTSGALEAYRRAIDLAPSDERIAGYVWLLVEARQREKLRALLPRLDAKAGDHPVLWPPLAAAHAIIGQARSALNYLQSEYPRRRNNPLWLLNYAAALTQAAAPREALRIRRRALVLLARAHPLTPKARQAQREALTRLAVALTPGNPALAFIKRLATHPNQPQSREIILTWALDRNAYPLARFWWLHAYASHPPEVRQRLALALGEQDDPALGALLARDAYRLSSAGRASAADRLGWTPRVISNSWAGLEQNSADPGLTRQFANTAIEQADSAGSDLEGLHASGLESLALDTRFDAWLSPGTHLSIRLSQAQQRIYDITQLGTIPPTSRVLDIELQRRLQRGAIRLEAGVGRSLGGYGKAGLSWKNHWTQRLSTTLGAYYGLQPLASVPLYLAAEENRIRFSANYQADRRNHLSTELYRAQYRAQGGGRLGDTLVLNFGFSHRLHFIAPILNLNAELTGARFTRATTLPQSLRSLVPAGQAPAINFFIPRNYLQICTGISLNTTYRLAYTPRLAPIVRAGLCYNSIYSGGYQLEVGLALPVFGPDHLTLMAGLEQGGADITGRSETIRLSYRYYFTL